MTDDALRTTAAIVGLLAPMAVPCAGWSQGVTDGSRLHLIEEGAAARTAGDHARALDLFTQAGRIEMRPGLRTSLAQEYEALGRHREACEQATHGVDEARADLSRPENVRALQGSADVVAAACPQVGLLRLHLPSDAGLQLIVQGRALDENTRELTVAVDPGAVLVQAISADGGSFRQELTLRAGATMEASVVLRHDAAPAHVANPATVPVPPPSMPAPPIAVPSVDHPSMWMAAGAGPWIVGGVGVASLGAAAIFYGVLRANALSQRNNVDCSNSTMTCTSAAQTDQSHAQTATTASNVAVGVGAAGLAGGVLWYVLGRGHGDTREHAGLTWDIGPTAGGAVVQMGGTM